MLAKHETILRPAPDARPETPQGFEFLNAIYNCRIRFNVGSEAGVTSPNAVLMQNPTINQLFSKVAHTLVRNLRACQVQMAQMAQFRQFFYAFVTNFCRSKS